MKLITLTPITTIIIFTREFQTILSNWKLVNTRQAMAIENKLKHTSIANIIHRGVYEIFCNTLILLIPCDTNDQMQVGIEIHSGRNRIVRRIFEHLGYQIEKLDRVYFAGITKKNLPRGRWRFLTQEEVRILKIY